MVQVTRTVRDKIPARSSRITARLRGRVGRHSKTVRHAVGVQIVVGDFVW